MTKETLKELIQVEFDRCLTLLQFKEEVFRLLDLYDEDNSKQLSGYMGGPILENLCSTGLPDEVPYSSTCPCNPANGGNGVCGCVMGNKMVPNPKKYGHPKTSFSTTTDIELQNPYSPTAKWITGQK